MTNAVYRAVSWEAVFFWRGLIRARTPLCSVASRSSWTERKIKKHKCVNFVCCPSVRCISNCFFASHTHLPPEGNPVRYPVFVSPKSSRAKSRRPRHLSSFPRGKPISHGTRTALIRVSKPSALPSGRSHQLNFSISSRSPRHPT